MTSRDSGFDVFTDVFSPGEMQSVISEQLRPDRVASGTT